MLSEDSNGQSEIVAVALIVNEDKESMLWIMNTFKLRNEEWAKVRVVMGDKDMNERNTIKQSFPSANVLICLFHTLRTFRREYVNCSTYIAKCFTCTYITLYMYIPYLSVSNFTVESKSFLDFSLRREFAILEMSFNNITLPDSWVSFCWTNFLLAFISKSNVAFSFNGFDNRLCFGKCL